MYKCVCVRVRVCVHVVLMWSINCAYLLSCYKLLLWQHCRFDDDGGGDIYSDVDDMEPVVSILMLACILIY